ncbi:hypothetical protein HYR99_32830 [Candidatus Poribacteria bacterium]|nr:hypothetical protein [Candidatus Poribacteria bacterium]
MRNLTEKEKAELKAKIAAEGVRQHQKEQKLISYKHQYRVNLGVSGFTSLGTGGQSYSRSLREAKHQQASTHVFNKGQPLRRIKLTEAEKEALRRKIDGEA